MCSNERESPFWFKNGTDHTPIPLFADRVSNNFHTDRPLTLRDPNPHRRNCPIFRHFCNTSPCRALCRQIPLLEWATADLSRRYRRDREVGWSSLHRDSVLPEGWARRSIAKTGRKMGRFWPCRCGWQTAGSAPIEKSFRNVAIRRDWIQWCRFRGQKGNSG
jgi:hypothetical protein